MLWWFQHDNRQLMIRCTGFISYCIQPWYKWETLAASGQSRWYSKLEVQRFGIEILRVQDLRTKSAKKLGDLLPGWFRSKWRDAWATSKTTSSHKKQCTFSSEGYTTTPLVWKNNILFQKKENWYLDFFYRYSFFILRPKSCAFISGLTHT